jgi:hypothetical protein
MRYTAKVLEGKINYVNAYMKRFNVRVHDRGGIAHNVYIEHYTSGQWIPKKIVACGSPRDCVYQLESFMECFFTLQQANAIVEA